jgi:hypothetical protein
MTPADFHLDGNAVAGLLEQVLVAEPTTAERICQSCRSRHPIGAHRAYAAAGTVLRCPTCGDVAVRLAELPGRRMVEFRGRWVFSAETGSPL